MGQIPLYPLRFEPIYQYRLWGGRRLAGLLKAPLPNTGPIGEAWVLSDRDDHPSRVANGPLQGRTIAQLLEQSQEELMGELAGRFHRFPVLLKFLDAREMLSVQVHPSDAHKDLLPAGETGKTEAWVVLEAGPESRIYAGLKPGTTADDLGLALAAGALSDRLACFTPKPGDGVFVPAGTVHALGGDIVVFEVQQNSDVTFRLYDWGHVDGKTGQPRPLQVDQALACTDYGGSQGGLLAPVLEAMAPVKRERLFQCGHFRLWRLSGPSLFTVGLPPLARPLPDESRPTAKNGRPHHGNLELLADPSSELVSAVEEVTITERQLAKRKLEHALEEEEDWFRARADQQAQREAEQSEAERRRKDAADDARRREERDNGWLRYAMRRVPFDARDQVEQEIHEQVQAALDEVRLGEPAIVAERVIDATVAKVLKPWRRSKDIAEAIEDARRSLPFEMRYSSWKPTTWESQACQAATKALEEVRPDASCDEMCAVAREAVKGVIAAFELQQAAVARERAEQRAEQEAAERSKRDRDNRERLLRYPWLRLPYGMPDADQQAALVAGQKAFAALPEGTSERDLEAARDNAIKPFLDSYARRERKEGLITAGLQQVLPCIKRLEEEWDFEKTAWTLSQEISEPMRKALQEVLTGDESAEEVGKRVRRLVRRQLEI